MKGLYKFQWDCGRMGDIEGVFVAESEDVENIIGKHIYFGEILGKHSEIYGNIEKGEIQLLTESVEAIEVVEKYNLSSGYNPFEYYEEEE